MNEITSDSRASGASKPALPSSEHMLIGIVLRPPQATWNGTELLQPRAANVDVQSVANLPGLIHVVVRKSFVGIVAQSSTAALDAAARLRVDWDDLPLTTRRLPDQVIWQQHGNDAAADASEQDSLECTYRWPVASHVDQTRAWAVASYENDQVIVWTNGEAGNLLADELSALVGAPVSIIANTANSLPMTQVLDVAADAALLAREVNRTVRVESRFDSSLCRDHHIEMRVRCMFDHSKELAHFELVSSEVPPGRPSMARLLAGIAVDGSYRRKTALFPYSAPSIALKVPGEVLISESPTEYALLASHVFAHESFMDEAAHHAGKDPVEYRLAQLRDARASALVRSVCAQADWSVPLQSTDPRVRRGRGIACAQVLDELSQPARQIWSVWVAEVSVNASGVVDLTRVVVGHHAEDLRDAAIDSLWVENRIKEEARALLQGSAFDDWRDRQGTLLTSPAGQAPSVDLLQTKGDVAREGTVRWSAAVMLPAAAALANAIFNATGVRLREPPFRAPQRQTALPSAKPGQTHRWGAAGWIGGLLGAATTLFLAVFPWRAPIAPTVRPDISLYSAAAIERGRTVASVGACAECHTAPGGAINAGGLPLQTPFGTIFSTNITPDPETGLGQWSYSAFERAMRQGIHRDGRHLYPAFPYTAFAKLSDGDLQALYAFLMSRPAVRHEVPATRLPFPLNLRPLLAGWNLLFHHETAYMPDPSRSAQWNRGRYLVDGPGHCGACHTPRNLLGAEKSGVHYLAGGMAEGWEAPPLNAQSKAPLYWTTADLYQYLRYGFAPRHGVAAGPMAPVVATLAVLPDSDLQAMADYLSSLQEDNAHRLPLAEEALLQEQLTAPDARLPGGAGERLFAGGCAACHEPGRGPVLFGSKPSLVLNTNLHSDRPDNVIQVILRGIQAPAHDELGYMPGFDASLKDAQITELAHYLRRRFAPDKPAWKNVAGTVQRIREETRALK